MFPSSITLRDYIQYNPSQGKIDCCTSSAILLSAEILLSQSKMHINFSRLYLYYMSRKYQNRLGQKGAKLRETLEALSIYGVVKESLWPFRHNRVEIEPPIQIVKEGINYRLNSFECITTSQYREYLNLGLPIIIGMLTGKQFWKLSGPLEQHDYKPINDIDNRQSRGHAVVCIGYDDNLLGGSWIIANSLGPGWGFQGYAAIPYQCNVDFIESYVITSFAGIVPDKKFSKIDK